MRCFDTPGRWPRDAERIARGRVVAQSNGAFALVTTAESQQMIEAASLDLWP